MAIHDSQLELIVRACEPFSYDHDKQLFKVGAKTVELADRQFQDKPYQHLSGSYMSWKEGQADPDALQARAAAIEKAPVVIGMFSTVVTLPRFNSWPKPEQALDDTKKIIKETYRLSGGPHTPEDADSGTGFVSFAARVDENGHVLLQTFGNCACFGPDPHGHITGGYEDWREGYVEYGFHNVDANFQAISLLAGIGHLAHLASQNA